VNHVIRRDLPSGPDQASQVQGGLWFGILGPLLVLRGGRAMDLGPPKRQLVLAALLCHANTPVGVDALIDALWDGRPPRTARKNLQVYVSSLRIQLPAAVDGPRITHRQDGYLLRADADELDWLAFERRAASARRPGQARCDQILRGQTIAGQLGCAVDLWRGAPLAGMRTVPLIDAAARRLEDRLLTVFEEWAEGEVAAGAAVTAIDRISEVSRDHPFRERLRLAQMAALNQLGRRTEALAVYDELRRSLARELGLSPGAALARYHQSLLAEDSPGRSAAASGGPAWLAEGALLPRDPTAFIGRAEATRDLMHALTDGGERLAVLSGPVGAGKTALAVHCAHRLGEQFPDGRIFVRVRGDGLDDALDWLVRAVAAAGWPVRNGDARGCWQHWLAGHRALIVLDDVRRESQARPFLPEVGESAVIVTSGLRLAGLGDACRLPVPPLRAGEAEEMLGRIIGRDRVAADRRAAERIVGAVGLLPLGVRIIGDKLAGLPHLPLREYLDRLARPPGLLDELAAADPTIRERLNEALDDLPHASRLALPHLARLPGPRFTLAEAASAISAAQDDTTDTIRILEALVEASVLTAPAAETTARTVVYELPPLMRAMAAQPGGRARQWPQAAGRGCVAHRAQHDLHGPDSGGESPRWLPRKARQSA
jgi:DNA-binding SARP family transcriptional activator